MSRHVIDRLPTGDGLGRRHLLWLGVATVTALVEAGCGHPSSSPADNHTVTPSPSSTDPSAKPDTQTSSIDGELSGDKIMKMTPEQIRKKFEIHESDYSGKGLEGYLEVYLERINAAQNILNGPWVPELITREQADKLARQFIQPALDGIFPPGLTSVDSQNYGYCAVVANKVNWASHDTGIAPQPPYRVESYVNSVTIDNKTQTISFNVGTRDNMTQEASKAIDVPPYATEPYRVTFYNIHPGPDGAVRATKIDG